MKLREVLEKHSLANNNEIRRLYIIQNVAGYTLSGTDLFFSVLQALPVMS